MHKEKIIAVVVTFNRKKELANCIESLIKQSLVPDNIVIIDNDSDDGTKEMIKNKFLNNNLVKYFNTGGNLGGAGGFNYGISKAIILKADWVWLMDDDGFAHKNQLEELLKFSRKNKLEFSNALVLDIENHKNLSFGLKGAIKKTEISKIQRDGIILNSVNPFNGTLIKKKSIDKIGNIKKEMFIWGDETEYLLRFCKAKIPIATVVSAVHYHPVKRGENFDFLFWSFTLKPKDKLNIYIRNLGYIHRKYKNFKTVILTLVGYSYFFIFKERFDITGLINFYRYYFDGFYDKYKLPKFIN